MNAFWNNKSLKPPAARKLAVRHTNLVCLTASFLATGGFVKLFNKIQWFFHDYLGFFSNSMIFPCMELFLVIFQVFHDSQSLWEPCVCDFNQHSYIIDMDHIQNIRYNKMIWGQFTAFVSGAPLIYMGWKFKSSKILNIQSSKT